MTEGATALTRRAKRTSAAVAEETALRSYGNQMDSRSIVTNMRRVLAAVVVLLALIACDNKTVDNSPAESGAQVDPQSPCDLLSPAQVEDAIDTEVRSEEEVDSHDPVTRICSYKTSQPWASVGVSLKSNVSHDRFDKAMRRDSINTDPVQGIGEGAFIHGCASITVYAEQVLVSASVQHLTTCEETSVVLKGLGKTIAATLQES